MDTKYLTYILTIAKHKNMTKAAEELYVSQSSLSQYLSKLEQEVGTPLFFRAKGELALTPAGQMYIHAASQVLQIKKQLYKDISALDSQTNLMIGATSQFALQMLSEIIPAFKSMYPNVNIEITEGNLSNITKLLLEEQLDMAVVASSRLSPFEDHHAILRREEVMVAIPADHSYCASNPGRSIPVDDFISIFSNDNFLLSKKSSSLRHLSDKLFAQYHFNPKAVCETNSVSTTQSMVSRGAGVAFIAQSCIAHEDQIHYYSLIPGIYRYNLLVWRQNWIMNPAEKALCDAIINYFKPYEAAV